jgi:hypothetical protein
LYLIERSGHVIVCCHRPVTRSFTDIAGTTTHSIIEKMPINSKKQFTVEVTLAFKVPAAFSTPLTSRPAAKETCWWNKESYRVIYV